MYYHEKIYTKRQIKIKKEANRRLQLWLKNSTFHEMTEGGSFTSFEYSLGLNGYTGKILSWMKGFDKYLIYNENRSPIYTQILLDIFNDITHQHLPDEELTKFIVTHIPSNNNLEKITQIFTNKKTAKQIYDEYLDQMKKNYCIYFEIIQILNIDGEIKKMPIFEEYHPKYDFDIKK